MSKSKIGKDSFLEKVDKSFIPGNRGWSKARQMVKMNPQRIEFQTSQEKTVLSLVLAILGVGIALWGFVSLFWFIDISAITVSSILMGIPMGITGIHGLISASNPMVFDKNEGYFWVGRKAPWQVSDLSDIKMIGQLSHIYSIQLIAGISTPELPVPRNQLNLVLKNGKRIFLFESRDYERIVSEGQTLSQLLDVPITGIKKGRMEEYKLTLEKQKSPLILKKRRRY